MKVPFLDLSLSHKPLREEFLTAWTETLENNRFCLGQDVSEFEKAFAQACGADEAVGVNNGTSALHLAALALGIGAVDEVIVPAFTFIASAWTASYVGAKLVFADVLPETYTLDPKSIEAQITSKTRAIVVVHLFGQPAAMDELMAIAKKHDLKLIEDCAQAHLATYKNNPVGLIGDVGTFSFYPTKNLGGCGEGGAVISKYPELLDTARHLRIHGMGERYVHDRVGYNYRMEGLQAAALSIKLKHLQGWTKRRQTIARRYREGLSLAELSVPQDQATGDSVYHQFTLLHPRRDALRAYLTENEIGTDLIYPIPLHLQPCFSDLDHGEGDFPVSEKIAQTCLSLPIFPDLTDEQVDYVIETINRFQG